MKKVLFLIVAALLCVSMQAQIVSSRSVGLKSSKVSSETEHFFRVGLNMMNFSGDGAEDLDSRMGYNIVYGFMKPMGGVGLYWGMDFGLGSRGYKYEGDGIENKLIAHNVQVSPFTWGWKYEVINNLKVDVHVGAYAGFDYTGKIELEVDGEEASVDMGDWDDDLDLDWHRYDVGLNAGFGVWYRSFNLDFTFQRGFIETAKESESYTSNFMIRLGVAF